jgi:medium-chain acyl-[acyl-carrier-protein] hydrolase
MVDMTLDRWIPFRNEDAAVRCRIFCLPHAAGSAAYYLPLRRIMPPEIDFCPLELPGHGARLDEQPIASMGELMEQLRRAIQPLMAVPFGFFGHSVGAHMAYEATRQMRAIDGRTAVHLFVSARGSPDRTSGAAAPAPRLRSDCELLAILERFGGTAPAITQRPELVSAILRALQADLLLVEGYQVDPRDHMNCPITAFGGSDDVPSGFLGSWQKLTASRFRTRMFPGGHFYVSTSAKELTEEIIEDLRESVGAYATAASPPA